VMGKPILLGEHTFNFADASTNAVKQGAAIRVDNVNHLKLQIEALMLDDDKRKMMAKAALAYSASETGATQKMLIIIAPYLSVKASLVD
jgi:3-deoxy-D-manno-octulosonic-acid transferase